MLEFKERVVSVPSEAATKRFVARVEVMRSGERRREWKLDILNESG